MSQQGGEEEKQDNVSQNQEDLDNISQHPSQQAQSVHQSQMAEQIAINKPCSQQGHDDVIVGICLKEVCEKKSRLVCFTCAISMHQDHAQFMVRLQDMGKQTQENIFIRNWPTEKLPIEINSYLLQNEPIMAEQNVDQIIENYKQKFINALDKIKDQIKKDVSSKLQKNEKNLRDLKLKLQDTYTLQSLKDMINEFNEEQYDEDEFNKKIKVWLNGKAKKVFVAELNELYQHKKKKVIKDHFKEELLHHYLDKSLKIVEEAPKEKNLWPTVQSLKSDIILK